MAQVNIRIDDRLKDEGEKLFRELGLSFSSAVSVFVSQAVRERAIPFLISEKRAVKDITLASEKALAKDWLLPNEDAAWKDL
jgi:DNA-damage-inducible protein J